MNMINEGLIFLLLGLATCNIWDNILSNSYAPYIEIPSNFNLVLRDNSTFVNNLIGISVTGDNNSIRVDYNASFSSLPSSVSLIKAVCNITKVTFT